MFSAKRRLQPWDALAAPRVSCEGSGQFAHLMMLSTQDPVGFFQTALTKRLDPLPIFFFFWMMGLMDYAYISSAFGSFVVLIFTGKLFYVMTPLSNLNLSVSNLILSALECSPRRTSFIFYISK